VRNLPADLSGPDKTHMCVRIWRGVSSVGEAKSLVEKSAYRTSGLKNVPVGFTSGRWALYGKEIPRRSTLADDGPQSGRDHEKGLH